MDVKEIQQIIESGLRRHYHAKVGQSLKIELPRLPLTRFTQYLKITPSVEDPSGTLKISHSPDDGEGLLTPNSLQAATLRSGHSRIVIQASHRLTGKKIEGLSPVAIEVDVTE